MSKKEIKEVQNQIFYAIIDSLDGDYILQAQILASMKPEGW